MNKKKYKIYKRILSTMLCLVLMLTGMPITASAQETLEDITVTIDTGEEVTLRDADGGGYMISGLYFNDEAAEHVGLFGYAKGEIKNVAVVTGIEGYDSAAHTVTRTIPVTVNKANTTYTAPTASTLVYNGAEQELISTDTVTGGTMLYSLEENGTYSETIPTGKNAGNYIVWYKVVGDENHNDVTPESVAVTIGKATPTISVDVSSGDLSPGTSVVIEALAKNPNNEALTDVPGITCTYRIGDAAASEFANEFSIPKGTAVGTVITITASTAEDANYTAATKTITITVQECVHTGGTQTCKGYQCTKCDEWYGDPAPHTPDMYGKCTATGCDKQYEAKIGNQFDTDINCFYDKWIDAMDVGHSSRSLWLLTDIYLTGDPLTRNITINGYGYMNLCGHTITVEDGCTLTWLGGNLNGLGMGATASASIVGNVADALVTREARYMIDINIQNRHQEGYALKVVDATHISGEYAVLGGNNIALTGGKADV